MEITQSNTDLISTELERLQLNWEELTIPQRTTIICKMIDRVCTVPDNDISVDDEEFDDENIDSLDMSDGTLTIFTRPTDPDLRVIYDMLCLLRHLNDKSTPMDTPYLFCNRTLFEVYESLPPQEQRRVQEHMETEDIATSISESPVMSYVLKNFIARNYTVV